MSGSGHSELTIYKCLSGVGGCGIYPSKILNIVVLYHISLLIELVIFISKNNITTYVNRFVSFSKHFKTRI